MIIRIPNLCNYGMHIVDALVVARILKFYGSAHHVNQKTLLTLKVSSFFFILDADVDFIIDIYFPRVCKEFIIGAHYK